MADGNVQRAGTGTNERLSSCLSSCTTGSGIQPPVGERGDGRSRERALDASVARRAKA